MSMNFGSYPTPLSRVTSLREFAHDVWLKDDGCTSDVYGGNKVRKLERLLAAAKARGAKRLLTIGAAGSHHVLATCLFGARFGFRTTAALLPQPWSSHAEQVLRAALNAGLIAVPCRSALAAAGYLWRMKTPDQFLIGPGGMGLEGTCAYMEAAHELFKQVEAAGSEPIDRIYVAAGSGSTAAGLLAGVLQAGLPTRIVAVAVANNPALRATIVGQALFALWKAGARPPSAGPPSAGPPSAGPPSAGPPSAGPSLRRALRALIVDEHFVGPGYGEPTPESAHAADVARSFGLSLDPTYTAKAFAAVLHAAAQTNWSAQAGKLGLRRRESYLYWHTLSSAPLTSLIEGAPLELPSELAELLPGPHPAKPLRVL